MNWELLGAGLVTALLGGVVVAIIQHFLSPKTRAETRQIAAHTAQSVIDSALENLRRDLDDTRSRAKAAETRADEADQRADDAKAENRILREHVSLLTSWAQRVYRAGVVKEDDPPPQLQQFEKPTT